MVSDARRVQKAKKIKDSINQQKVFFFIGAFQYTSVSVGKGVRPLFIFFFRACFFRIFFEKKSENRNFWAILGFWKKGGVSLVGIRKYWDLFFLLGQAGFFEFQELFCRILVWGGIGGSAPWYGISGLLPYFLFFFENVELYFLRLSAPLENRGGLAGGNSKILGPFFFVLVRAGSLNFKNFFAVFWFEAV